MAYDRLLVVDAAKSTPHLTDAPSPGDVPTFDGTTYVPQPGGTPADITDIPTAETDTSKRLAPDGAGGVTWGTGGGAPDTADYLVGTAQAGLSAEIVVGTTPGGELGGTWASPTVDSTHSGSSHAGAAAAAVATHEGLADPHAQYATNAEFDDHSARHEDGGADEISIAGLAGTPIAVQDHLDDATDAHDASAISVADAGNYFTGTEVEAALQELGAAAFGGGTAPSNADYLVGTANGSLSAEIVVGTSPGGELGGTWASPTVDATHSGSAHGDFIAKAFLDAKGDLISASAADTPALLGVGSDGQGLVADSTASSGLRWGPKLPSFVAAGALAHGTGDVTPALYAGNAADDIMVLVVQSANQAVTAPANWTQMGPQVGFGVAAAALSVRLALFWKRHDGSESDPTVTDTGDHTLAFTFGIRGCPTSGDPFESVGQRRKTTASVTATADGGATSWPNCLVVDIFAHGIDTTTPAFSAPTNADLANVTEQADVANDDGQGGGMCVITGEKTVAGTFAGTTSTMTSGTDVASTFVFLPLGAYPKSDRQVFTTPGYSDTWVKRTGARRVKVWAIGGGASGSAGRNASVAAGGGGGGGGMFQSAEFDANTLASTMTVLAGAGGAATANSDGAASNAGNNSTVTDNARIILAGNGGGAAGVSATGSGGAGGAGGGRGTALANGNPGTASYTWQPPGGGTGATTAAAGGAAQGESGAGGAGGGTSQATSAGGASSYGGAGGGGGRSNTNVGTGGASIQGSQLAGGASAGAAGTDSPYPEFGGAGGAGGTSAAGPGGQGGWPGGGGGGGGSQSGAQRGGAGGDGVVVIVTTC